MLLGLWLLCAGVFRMGIIQLNKFMKKNCDRGIYNRMHLAKLRGKCVVIDASIYMYRYKSNGVSSSKDMDDEAKCHETLIEGFYAMCSLLLKYGVRPVFVFDGKPPKDKWATIDKRRANREDAYKEYVKMETEMKSVKDVLDAKDLEERMDALCLQFVKVKAEDTEIVRKLMDVMGVEYIMAKEEADVVCAQMVMSGEAWACLSEDSDMFAYGIPRILRFFSILNHTVICFYMDEILRQLDMPLESFKELCVLSGTDYRNMNTNIWKTYDRYMQYKDDNVNVSLFKIFKDGDLISLATVYNKYCIGTEKPKEFNRENRPKRDDANMRTFLQKYGFIFPIRRET